MLSDGQVGNIIQRELDAAISYEGEIAKKREKLLNYYNARPYGDEVEGQSSVVTTDVADVVEWMLPSLLRIFTQGKLVGRFTGHLPEDEELAGGERVAALDAVDEEPVRLVVAYVVRDHRRAGAVEERQRQAVGRLRRRARPRSVHGHRRQPQGVRA